MENKKLSHICNCFCKESCKQKNCHCHQNTEDKELKGRILEAELHKDLLINEIQTCSPEHCQDCNSVLC